MRRSGFGGRGWGRGDGGRGRGRGDGGRGRLGHRNGDQATTLAHRSEIVSSGKVSSSLFYFYFYNTTNNRMFSKKKLFSSEMVFK